MHAITCCDMAADALECLAKCSVSKRFGMLRFN